MIFRDLEEFLEVLVNIFKVFFVDLLQKSLKLRKVTPQAIVTRLFDPPLMPPHCIGRRFYP